MKPATVATLLLCFLLVALTYSAPLSSAPPAALRVAAERAKTLVEKILRDVPAVHEAAVTMQVNKASDWLLTLFFFSC
ncbi:hypothetical protein NQZ68_025375 [Dissostichus eleginoides]|nr:hypothetical protein NQZ68_025375 [Dissostichus eleginoides]